MQTALNKQEIDMLQLRIAASPPEERAELQSQLDALVHALGRAPTPQVTREPNHDAVVEALFDNMPV